MSEKSEIQGEVPFHNISQIGGQSHQFSFTSEWLHCPRSLFQNRKDQEILFRKTVDAILDDIYIFKMFQWYLAGQLPMDNWQLVQGMNFFHFFCFPSLSDKKALVKFWPKREGQWITILWLHDLVSETSGQAFLPSLYHSTHHHYDAPDNPPKCWAQGQTPTKLYNGKSRNV